MADKGAPDGICIAFGANAYALSPTWTRIDDTSVPAFTAKGSSPHNCNIVSSWTVDRGRSYELDKTQTGTATITCQDPNGLLDPTNAASPFYGLIRPMLRCSITLEDPANQQFIVVFTGFIESFNWTMTTEENLMIVTIHLVDGFEPLARAELTPDYGGTGFTNAGNGTTVLVGDINQTACQTRIFNLLTSAGWPTDSLAGPVSRWRNVNTGNVFLQQTIYNPQTSVLSAIQDAADAEFPGVANVFMNKAGAVSFYGRYPRFQPTNYPQLINLWNVADRGGSGIFIPPAGVALIYDIEWNLDQTHLYNACLCYPSGIDQTLVSGQLYTDAASAAIYGYRSLTQSDLLTAGQPLTPSQSAANTNNTCLFYAQYYVKNYKDPSLRISKLEFHSRPIGDSTSWLFMTNVEIGDLLTVYTSDPGGGGFGKETDGLAVAQFFVEGIHYQVNPLSDGYLDVVLNLDVSPRAWFTTMTWT